MIELQQGQSWCGQRDCIRIVRKARQTGLLVQLTRIAGVCNMTQTELRHWIKRNKAVCIYDAPKRSR